MKKIFYKKTTYSEIFVFKYDLNNLKILKSEFAKKHKEIEEFKSIKRKLEYLYVRKVLNKIDVYDNICYTKNGKPFFKNIKTNLNISHSNSMISMILSKTKKVSVDIQSYSKKLENIKHKYIFDGDIVNSNINKKNLYIWCAKECAYKTGISDNVNNNNYLVNIKKSTFAVVFIKDKNFYLDCFFEKINSDTVLCYSEL